MKQKFILSLLGLILSFTISVPVLALAAPDAAVEITQDYDTVFLSLSAIVAVIPLVVEVVKGFFLSMKGGMAQVLSWVVGIGITMFGWWQQLGFLDGIEWYIALLYGLGSGLAANGIADTGLIEWVIGLFRRKDKVKV